MSATMLDFLQIQTPQKNGQVLVLPEPNRMVQALRENGQILDSANTKILNYPLSYWRKKNQRSSRWVFRYSVNCDRSSTRFHASGRLG